jgi:CHAT domain-containing protein
LGDLDTAREAAAGAVDIVELLRSPLPTDFSLRRDFYELYVEILMRLHEREPDKGFDISAFNAAEAARSHSLLDDVKELAANSGSDEPSLLGKKAALEGKLKELELKRWALPQTHERQNAIRETLDREARDAETELAIVRADLEKRGLEGSPRPLILREVQSNLAPDTVLLAYFLGRDRSFLWEVTRDQFLTHKLRGRSEIEPQADKVLRQLSRSSPREWQAWMPALRELSGTLLSKATSALEGRQLLIAPDGVLYLVPFAALLDPRTLGRRGPPGEGPTSPRFLVLDHQVVSVPSVSVVAATRAALAGRPHAPEAIAIFADPVFDARHPRSGLPRGGEIRETEFKPLPFSLQEAQAIVEAIQPARSFLATGFRANHATAVDPAMGRYGVIHFATHGLLRDRPDRSGIVLSLLDEHGVPQDGFLRAFEIYDLKLSSDLVVLSACQTALGGEKGGLVRAFLHAGSRSVMATLWPVQDRSTALLMEAFYRKRGLRPAEALQQAQIELLRNPRWKVPHYWAGFALNGEWR